MAKGTKVDAILLDMEMPGMGGVEAAKHIRSNPAYAHLHIIALTANAMQSDRERCLEVGMDDHIAKPMRTDELHEKLARWIEVKGA